MSGTCRPAPDAQCAQLQPAVEPCSFVDCFQFAGGGGAGGGDSAARVGQAKAAAASLNQSDPERSFEIPQLLGHCPLGEEE